MHLSIFSNIKEKNQKEQMCYCHSLPLRLLLKKGRIKVLFMQIAKYYAVEGLKWRKYSEV